MKGLHARVIRLAHEKPALRGHLLLALRMASNKWFGVALDELAEELDLDREGLKVGRGSRIKDGFEVESRGRGSNGESEWTIFKDWKAAEKYAYDYVKEQLEEEPGIFDQKWLRGYLSVSPTDARIMASEEADARWDDEDDESVLAEADLEDEYAELDEAVDEIDEEIGDLEIERDELDYDEGGEDAYDKAYAALEKKIEDAEKKRDKLGRDLEKKKEKLVDEAREQVKEAHSDEIEKQLKRDPLGWYEDMMGSVDEIPSWLHVDVDKAAKAALRADGVDHFLDRYDGDSVELDSGAVCFGTN